MFYQGKGVWGGVTGFLHSPFCEAHPPGLSTRELLDNRRAHTYPFVLITAGFGADKWHLWRNQFPCILSPEHLHRDPSTIQIKHQEFIPHSVSSLHRWVYKSTIKQSNQESLKPLTNYQSNSAYLLKAYEALFLLAGESHNLNSLTAWATAYKIIKKKKKKN